MSVPGRIASGGSLAGVLVLYAAGVLLVAGALSVPLLGLLPADAAASLGLNRMAYRLAELLALVGLFPLLGLTGGVSAAAWGYAAVPFPRWVGEVAVGLAAGVATLGLFVGVLLATGLRVPRPDLDVDAAWLAGLVASAAGSALLISLVEETWFRGGLHTLCARLVRPFTAVLVCSAIYAVLHFFRPPELPEGAVPTPLDGLRLLGLAPARLAEPGVVGPLLTLFAVGVVLGLVRERTGRIAICIGLHAGWVIVIKVTKDLTFLTTDRSLLRLVDGYDGVIGWAALPWFAGLAFAYARLAAPARPAPP